jgi:hypothetical protein
MPMYFTSLEVLPLILLSPYHLVDIRSNENALHIDLYQQTYHAYTTCEFLCHSKCTIEYPYYFVLLLGSY